MYFLYEITKNKVMVKHNINNKYENNIRRRIELLFRTLKGNISTEAIDKLQKKINDDKEFNEKVNVENLDQSIKEELSNTIRMLLRTYLYYNKVNIFKDDFKKYKEFSDAEGEFSEKSLNEIVKEIL